MTTTLAKVTALALLAASFAFSGSLAYADTKDTTSIQILTFDAVGNPGEIIVALDCDTGDGMGNCPVETVVAADTVATTVADAFDPAVLEAAAETTVATDTVELAIQPVDAIVVTGDTAIELLRPRRERPSRRPAEPRNELPPLHPWNPFLEIRGGYRGGGCIWLREVEEFRSEPDSRRQIGRTRRWSPR
jgi:hypothetical protein